MTLCSQNGWKASKNRNAIGVKNYIIPGANQHISCAKAVAPVLIAFLAEFNRLVEPINKPGSRFDDWGHHFKIIPGSSVMSNHGSGTAVDINSVTYPWKKRNYKPVKVLKIRRLCKKYGIRWGGDYKYSVDEMHFEVIESPEQVKERIIRMKLPMPKEGTIK